MPATPRERPLVGIVMGSETDRSTMEEAARVLEEYGVPCEVAVRSAHRTPEATARWARTARGRGLRVLIAGAGGAAHLAGALAAQSRLPVLGVPLASSPLGGFDALLSTVQMPPGVPVGTLGVGSWGARNAAHLAVRILALGDARLARALEARATPRAAGAEALMRLLKVDPEKPDEQVMLAAAEAVLRGGVVGFPTDTTYGLGCSLFDVAAVEMVGRLKRRDPSLAVISLISDPRQIYGLGTDISPIAETLVARFWPGPLSLIFRAAPIVPARVRGAGGTVALRCPKDRLCNTLLEFIGGPVVSSSANLSGQPPAETAEEVLRVFGNQLDLVIDGGPRRGGVPSTLVDVSGGRPRLLRRGELDVTAVLGDFEDATGD